MVSTTVSNVVLSDSEIFTNKNLQNSKIYRLDVLTTAQHDTFLNKILTLWNLFIMAFISDLGFVI
ncbi:hypothetical protein DCO58_09980 [Helicobacter saguini]|uniref:Uncharacterized protein n=1 Tax=Helicobacter saguini TaxID=1548018 RepID=A0A4U8T5E3_9HELI|nr:hypothetical protein [Helicobacter saguini]MWV61366.1 hypothetical protein [Helicobacter saguini]MWV67965.1 hypothetical protein [Helicobacter saguini]MWV70568.1 hypothetical protein [Helicobacter saguini]MWV72471.1 hypothetical protein [Helicobacter saguini]TLD94776.1 hypothetical protein LS64_004545 [Helicobacter saguini]